MKHHALLQLQLRNFNSTVPKGAPTQRCDNHPHQPQITRIAIGSRCGTRMAEYRTMVSGSIAAGKVGGQACHQSTRRLQKAIGYPWSFSRCTPALARRLPHRFFLDGSPASPPRAGFGSWNSRTTRQWQGMEGQIQVPGIALGSLEFWGVAQSPSPARNPSLQLVIVHVPASPRTWVGATSQDGVRQ